jgi:ketosteroid isomerase-like protein
MTTSGMMPEGPTTPDQELVRRIVDAFNRGDIDGVLAMFTPDAVLDMSPVGMGVFEGREAIRGFYDDAFVSYEDFEQEIEEPRYLGNGVGFAVIAAHGRLQGSASWLDVRFAGVAIWTKWAGRADDLLHRHRPGPRSRRRARRGTG